MWNGVKIKEGRRIFCDALFDILMLLADWEITSRSKLREVILYCTKKNPAAEAGCRILYFRDQ